MDLQTLTFKVETGELTKAVTAIKELGAEVSKLNKPVKESTVSTEKATKATKENTTVLQRQQDILKYMTEGYSKGQASVMAYAKASGALNGDIELLGKTLKTQRTLMGTDPFDKSIGALQTLRNEYKMVNEVQNLYNQNLGLTKSQMETLAREKQRLIALYEIEGKDVKNLELEYKLLVDEATRIAQAENAIATSMRNKEKALTETAKANAYLEKETRRLDSALKETNKDLSSGSNNALLRFEEALRKSGKTAAEQSVALEAYRQKLTAVNKASGNRQVDYLSRALGPQITDIGVGLLTGQSPLMVLLQQGGQLRDQFALAGVAGKDMGKMLVDASKAMVTSIKDVALAVGGLLFNALKSVATTISGGMFTLFVDGFKALVLGGEAAVVSLERVKLAAIGLGKVGLVALVATLAALGKGFYDSVVQSDALVKQLTLTGGSLGLTKDQAIRYAEALNTVGISTTKTLSVISAMAKEGGFLASQIALVTKAAVDMQTYAGVPIEDTVKSFAKMRDEPVKAMFELAKATGMVPAETIRAVVELEKHGKAAEATALAIKTLAEINRTQISKMKEDYSSFAIFMKETGAAIADFFDKVFTDLWYKADPKTAIKEQIAAIDDLLSNNAGLAGIVVGKFGIGEEGFKAQKAALQENLRLIEKAAAAEQDRKAHASEIAKAYEGYNKDQEQFATNRQKREKEIAEATVRNQKLIADGIITQAQHEEQIANIRKKYKDEQRSLTFFESEMQNAQKMVAVYEDAQINMNEAQKRMLSLAVDPRFLEEGQKRQQEIMVALVKASNEINAKTRFQYGTKNNAALLEENEALRVQTEMIGATDIAKIKYTRTLEAEKKYRAELLDIDKQAWSSSDKELERMAALERYNQRVKNADTEIANVLKAERVNAYGAAFENAFNGMADALTTFALTGKLSFKGLIDSMITDLIRFEMRAQMTAVYRSIGGAQGIMSAFTGGWQSGTQASGATVGGPMSGGGQSMVATPIGPLQADGGAWANGLQMFAKGGSFTNSIVDSPTLFKFAKGTGMMGEAGPEAIMPLRRGADGSLGVQAQGGGSNVQISVINNTSSQATTKESTDSRGNRKIEVIIGDMTASEVQRSGSSSQKAMKNTFGIQPALIRR
jgi:phage-related minor tail protein